MVAADWFLDASETGALLPLTGAEHVTGFESQAMTGEPHAPAEHQPDNLQPVTVCFAVDHLAGEDHTIPRPARYDELRRALQLGRAGPADEPPGRAPPRAQPRRGRARDRARLRRPRARQGPLALPPHRRARPVRARRVPLRHHARELAAGRLPRRARCSTRRRPARASSACRSCTGCRPRRLPRPAPARRRRRRHARRPRQAPLHPRGAAPAGGHDRARAGPHRRARARASPTASASAPTASTCTRRPAATPTSTSRAARSRSRSARSSRSGVENLIGAGKAIGTTHITNGAYRLHPVEWNIGEAAGHLAAHCAARGTLRGPCRRRRPELQRELEAAGVELRWRSASPNGQLGPCGRRSSRLGSPARVGVSRRHVDRSRRRGISDEAGFA